MDRLTHPLSTKCSMSPWDWCGLDNVCNRDCFKPTPCPIPKKLRRLAEYEDTGLMPVEVENYKRIIKREVMIKKNE